MYRTTFKNNIQKTACSQNLKLASAFIPAVPNTPYTLDSAKKSFKSDTTVVGEGKPLQLQFFNFLPI